MSDTDMGVRRRGGGKRAFAPLKIVTKTQNIVENL